MMIRCMTVQEYMLYVLRTLSLRLRKWELFVWESLLIYLSTGKQKNTQYTNMVLYTESQLKKSWREYKKEMDEMDLPAPTFNEFREMFESYWEDHYEQEGRADR